MTKDFFINLGLSISVGMLIACVISNNMNTSFKNYNRKIIISQYLDTYEKGMR